MQSYSLFEHLLFPPTLLNREKLGRELEGKTMLITGASSGIGEQLAYLLAENKVHLILVARREECPYGFRIAAARMMFVIGDQALRYIVFTYNYYFYYILDQ